MLYHDEIFRPVAHTTRKQLDGRLTGFLIGIPLLMPHVIERSREKLTFAMRAGICISMSVCRGNESR